MIAAIVAGASLLTALGLLVWLCEHAPLVEEPEEIVDADLDQIGIGCDALTAEDRLVLHRGVSKEPS